jgi:hypothetical protein
MYRKRARIVQRLKSRVTGALHLLNKYPGEVSDLVRPSYIAPRYQSRPDLQGIIHRAESSIARHYSSRCIVHCVVFSSRGIIIARYSPSRGILHRAASSSCGIIHRTVSQSRGINHRAASSSHGITIARYQPSRGIFIVRHYPSHDLPIARHAHQPGAAHGVWLQSARFGTRARRTTEA